MKRSNILNNTAARAAFAILALTGCSSDPGTNKLIAEALPFKQHTRQLAQGYEAATSSGSPRFVAAVESRPDAIALFLRKTRSEASGVSTWFAGDGSQILLDRGILVGTRGFGADVMASDVSQSASLIHRFGSGYTTRLMTIIDGEDHAVTRAFKCHITPGAIDPVVVGAQSIVARTVTEECRGSIASFENYYWVVPASGEIIQSSQWAGPLTDKISIRSVQLGAL